MNICARFVENHCINNKIITAKIAWLSYIVKNCGCWQYIHALWTLNLQFSVSCFCFEIWGLSKSATNPLGKYDHWLGNIKYKIFLPEYAINLLKLKAHKFVILFGKDKISCLSDFLSVVRTFFPKTVAELGLTAFNGNLLESCLHYAISYQRFSEERLWSQLSQSH